MRDLRRTSNQKIIDISIIALVFFIGLIFLFIASINHNFI